MCSRSFKTLRCMLVVLPTVGSDQSSAPLAVHLFKKKWQCHARLLMHTPCLRDTPSRLNNMYCTQCHMHWCFGLVHASHNASILLLMAAAAHMHHNTVDSHKIF
eukprot:GHUV01031300.1.p3 GENE.GHUV01031300.1~~GHUV01031300.1.p3  ORF type:complete len:104 (-),score=9.30 GHUV01031300.1:1437-1748(-)